MTEALLKAGEGSAAANLTRDRIWMIATVASGLVVAVKLLLVARININWDEFLYLTQVHAYERGELTSVFQTPFVHLFTWLPAIRGDEVAQIIAARWLMMVLFAVSVALLARLASRWASPAFVWIAPLCYVATSPVLAHGGSFRADSLLLPLTLGALVLLTRPARSLRATIFAAVCLGAAIVVSIKAVFLLPTVIALELLNLPQSKSGWQHSARDMIKRLAILGSVAGVLVGVIFAVHAWSLSAPPEMDARTFASATAHKTLLDVPFFPRWDYLRISLKWDKATWILLAIGAFVAVKRRLWPALACGLSLLPLLIYRNAFPYYYLIMLAPACVLAPIAAEGLQAFASRGTTAARARWVPVAPCILLLLQAAVLLPRLAPDAQVAERATVAAVHRIFPTPVPYIDHSGMIASFRKTNFFMSSWGVETYRAVGKSFMVEAIARYRPPLLLVNRGELDPDSYPFTWLLPQDQQLIREYYVPYWGPIRVAGTQVEVPPAAGVEAHVPFPGRYRLVSEVPVLVDGVPRSAGDVVTLERDSCVLSLNSPAGIERPAIVRLVWADAAPPPATEPPDTGIYTGL